MRFWPFQKRSPEPLTPLQLRDRLIETAGLRNARRLRAICRDYKQQIVQNLEFICRIPDEMPTDDEAIDRWAQNLGAVAQCLAGKCGSPEMWNHLCGNPDDNPLLKFDRWYGELPERMKRLEHDALIAEAGELIEQARTLRGSAARTHECWLLGRLGELLFHSGRPSDAVSPYSDAFDLCVTADDTEGQIIYLQNLLEVHCYLADGLEIKTAERLLDIERRSKVATDLTEKRLRMLQNGVPLCRCVCVRNGQELELDEIRSVGRGSYQFIFKRNRMSLQKAITLTQQGNQLASADRFSDALEKFTEASDVDPYDPDPIYQSGVSLLHLGLYAQAREAFEDVERLAPGWFRCRSDRWLADGLDSGSITDEQFQLLRILEDGCLNPAQSASIAQQAVERFPDFAPFYLCLGDTATNESDVVSAYRRGLEVVEEPDLESRLLCALAGRLSAENVERK
ncbi:MAG: hypothetical protein KDA91_25695, partial [Planctomycetaceae bacterium]|nr:hypothetical protein [Planctomycetaceae bacterium]